MAYQSILGTKTKSFLRTCFLFTLETIRLQTIVFHAYENMRQIQSNGNRFPTMFFKMPNCPCQETSCFLA